jgi:hypothetical protein
MRMRHAGKVVTLAISLLLGANAMTGCGSDGDGGSAGAGGAGGRACVPGETQGCLCAGQVAGAQVCAGDGMSWGRCECGAGVGGGGGGIAGADSGAGSGGAGAGGIAAAGGAGEAGASGTAGADAATPKQPGPLDDPCPDPSLYPNGIDVNCSDQCSPTHDALCAPCQLDESDHVLPLIKISGADLPVIIRLPAIPPMTCACGIPGEQQSQQYTIGLEATLSLGFFVEVGKPWYVKRSYVPTCIDELDRWRPGCEQAGGGRAIIQIATDDPSAPSRNAVIRAPRNGELLSCDGKYWN